MGRVQRLHSVENMRTNCKETRNGQSLNKYCIIKISAYDTKQKDIIYGMIIMMIELTKRRKYKHMI